MRCIGACTTDYVDGYGEVEFLNALVVPLTDSSGVTFMKGVDGFPAFSFASTANVRRPAGELVYRVGPDFSLVASVLPFTAAGGSVSHILDRNVFCLCLMSLCLAPQSFGGKAP